jgi:hypothetical protein
VPKRAWQKLSAGAGAKGHRFYDWTVIDLAEPRPGSRQLLIRRDRTTGELAYHRCFSPAPVPLTALVRVAGSRWQVEAHLAGCPHCTEYLAQMRETIWLTGRPEPEDLTGQQRDEFVALCRRWRAEQA